MRLARRVARALVILSITIGAGAAATHLRSDALPDSPAADAFRAQPADQQKPDRAQSLTFVSNADKSPLPNSHVWIKTNGYQLRTWEGATDDNGQYSVVPPSGAMPLGFYIMIAQPAYAPSFLASGFGVPDHTLALEPAETIGGTVCDEKGQPIAGARVLATAYPFMFSWPEIDTSPNSGLVIATTDAHGRWRSNSLPVNARPEARVRVLVTHFDHIMDEFETTAAQARAFSSVQAMKTGLSVSGTVVSPFGRPVSGATVVVGLRPWAGLRQWETMYLQLVTRDDGKFDTGRCLDRRWPKSIVVVHATGLAIGTGEIHPTPDAAPQVIRLTRRRPIEGRAVDAHGRPLAGAVVTSSRSAFDGLLCWDAETDDDGKFVWYDAPTDVTILLSVSKPTLTPVRARAIYPDAREVTFTLYEP